MPQGPTAYHLTGGSGGIHLVSGESMTAGNTAMAIHANTDTTFTTLTGNVAGADASTLYAGHDLFGRYTAITVNSGDIYVYYL